MGLSPNTGPGKLAHSGDEALIDGLNIRWEEQLPGNPQPLIQNQYYNFVKLSGGDAVLVETNTPGIIVNHDIWVRDCPTFSQSGTIPGSAPIRIYINQAPLGSSPDPLWLTLPDEIGVEWSATINGSPATVVVDTNTTPSPGTIHITDLEAGEVYFAAADSSQSYTINGYYVRNGDF